jgi:hypothetical protein
MLMANMRPTPRILFPSYDRIDANNNTVVIAWIQVLLAYTSSRLFSCPTDAMHHLIERLDETTSFVVHPDILCYSNSLLLPGGGSSP